MRRLLFYLFRFLVNTLLLLATMASLAALAFSNSSLLFKVTSAGFVVFLLSLRRFITRRQKSNRERPPYQEDYVIISDTNEFEHRYIAKQQLKRPLFSNEVVHHINGIRSDNRLINLCVMEREQHELFHAWLAWKKKKSGRYPNFREQKRILRETHKGILLEGFLGSPNGSRSPSMRSNFVPNRSANDGEPQDDSSRHLFSDLRRLRNRLARENNIPAYLVFKNFTLIEMSRLVPHDAETIMEIAGVTPEKFRLYGDHFLEIIWKHSKDQNKRRSV